MEQDQKSRRMIVFCLLSVVVLLGMALYFFMSPSKEESKTSDIVELSETETAAEKKILVYVVGAVKAPGVYEIPSQSRVFDAVKAAGDVLPYADMEAVNMAETVTDGEKIYMPLAPDRATGDSHLVNINQATAEELTALPGVGPATAEKIVQYREEHGFFQKKEDIKKVPSIGDSKFLKMAEKITL